MRFRRTGIVLASLALALSAVPVFAQEDQNKAILEGYPCPSGLSAQWGHLGGHIILCAHPDLRGVWLEGTPGANLNDLTATTEDQHLLLLLILRSQAQVLRNQVHILENQTRILDYLEEPECEAGSDVKDR